MSHSLDDFINYSNNNDNADFLNKDFPNFDFDFAPPENTENDLFRNFPLNFPKTIQNVLDHDNNEANLGFIFNFDDVQPVVHQVPNTQERSQSNESYENFTTMEQTLSTCSPHTAEENEQGLSNGSKKITKREKAKLKAKAKQESLKEMLETVDKKYIPEGFYDPNLDEEAKKKMIQVIRNRVSAQSSRDKKKNYVQELEQEKAELEQRNNKLAKENTILNEKLLNREIECRSLMEQIEALKKKEAAGCLKCGPTSDFGRSDTNDTNEITDESASVGSGASSPLLYRGVGGGRGRLFGFGATFTAFLCMMLVMYGTSDENGKKHTNLYTDKYAPTKLTKDEVLHKAEKLIKTEEQPIQYREFDLEDTNPKVNRLKPLVERFEKTLDEVLAAYEKSQVVVDLANKKFDTPSKITSSNSSKSNSFLGKNSSQKAQKNATATLVLSNGFEVQKNESNMPSTTMTNTQFIEEVVGDDGMLQKGGSLDIEKAEYVQLFVPKSALGQIGGPQNLEFGNLPTLKEEGENNSDSLLEIWCKIFAIRDASEAI